MTAEDRIARVFGLNEEGWARHANPWSGWSRFITCLPLLILAIWSRIWLGWMSLGLIAIAILWIWLNPRAFGPATTDKAWITKGVLGERFWSCREEALIPIQHRRVPHILNLVALSGIPFLIWGLVLLEPWSTAMGSVLVIGGKLWYIDRMSLLYEDVVRARPELRYSKTETQHIKV